jgi:RNA polymerase sigma factor (sigma-70 family)
VDKKRKKSVPSLSDLVYQDEEGEMVWPEALLTDSTSPDSEFERSFVRESFFAALNELPHKQREVFVWNELEDMTLQEIADKTGTNIKTIISRKRYAVAHLRERLQSLYDDY